ncbi:MAG: hydantoinase/oxoprolinase family protein [Actinomycetota bacterium]
MPARFDLRLGIDVGGTHTDAVVVDPADQVVAKAKVTTTADITSGITTAIQAVLDLLQPEPEFTAYRRTRSVRERITHVMLGTTHATNAVLRCAGLGRVAVIRIGGPATRAVPPLVTWPTDLRSAISAGEIIVDGGMDFDGRAIAPLDGDAIARFLEPLSGRIDAVAVASVFSSVSDEHELQAAEIASAVLGHTTLSLSSEIGSIGLLERENATILNAALVGVVRDVATALTQALDDEQLTAKAFFAQNDGTLMALDYAVRYPVLTIGCGPANSMRGAAFLSETTEGLVADVGGTSTDIGALVNGFPCESTEVIGIGGVQTNFRMPHVISVPVAGGTVIAEDGDIVRVGPDSVGYHLDERALVFSGETPTLTDAAVAAGRTSLGTRRPPRSFRKTLEAALAHFDAVLAQAVDRAKVIRGDPILIVVGGGGFLVPDHLPGIAEIRRPEHSEVANAIGAAIAPVSGQVERLVHFGRHGREAVLREVQETACAQAVRAGADPQRVEVVEIEEVPLAYLTDPAVRLRVKAAGPLSFN